MGCDFLENYHVGYFFSQWEGPTGPGLKKFTNPGIFSTFPLEHDSPSHSGSNMKTDPWWVIFMPNMCTRAPSITVKKN